METVLHFRALLLGFLVILSLALVSVACAGSPAAPTEAPTPAPVATTVPVAPSPSPEPPAATPTTETTVAPTPTPTPEKPTYTDARGHTLPSLDTGGIEDGIIGLINERRRSLGLEELIRDPALDDLARANSTVNSTNKARAGTFTKNHPESDCETVIQVFQASPGATLWLPVFTTYRILRDGICRQ